MSLIDDKMANQAIDNGTLLGGTEPERETKFSFWQVYAHEGRIIAAVFQAPDGWYCCAEEITEDKLHLYCDDADAAKKKLKAIAPPAHPTGHTEGEG